MSHYHNRIGDADFAAAEGGVSCCPQRAPPQGFRSKNGRKREQRRAFRPFFAIITVSALQKLSHSSRRDGCAAARREGGRNENAIIAAMNREISLLFSFPNSELLTIRHVVRIKVKSARAWNSSDYRRPPETPGAVHKEINTEKPQSFIKECCSKGTFAGCSVFRRKYTMFILKKS